ncbi:thermonuclease family protein [Phytoactinopolyspora halotolerans]|uniref:Thermonuclease family protein n=1 Tax=Phytoactinopolyspora halotolerans TaxID=1981512 RepID=A0A6L9SEE2_9ACTN|nr:thermonuclease family protein [Phytoactinopolyspora halotolerans]NEE03775.1 thermonuclease family protein [Phytoactinopolyspora halotolerans]
MVKRQRRRACTVAVAVLAVSAAGCSLVEPDESDVSTTERATTAERERSSSTDEQTAPSESGDAQAEPETETAPDDTDTKPDGDYAVVVYVVDGDTFDVELADGTVERIRPPQVDTPERGECGFDEATRVTEELVLGEPVELFRTSDGPDRDPYDRLLRAVEVDGDDVGAILVRSGAARWVPRYADEDPRLAAMYQAAEAQARNELIGFWSGCGWA